ANRYNLTGLIIGEPTHRAGNTLDLAWTNINGTIAWVDRNECVTSDHLPIRGQVPNKSAFIDAQPAKIRVSRRNLPRFAQAIAQWVRPPSALDTIEEVEAYAQDLCSHLENAIKATGSRVRKCGGKSAPWWTSECKSAKVRYQAATPSQRTILAKELRETIKAAKKEHQEREIEAMTTAADIFKLMRAANPQQSKIPPPLSHEGALITDPAERATILRDALLARHQASDDL
ncbi:hypothetical protein K3495_g16839, partial [Podosphaera aphanis]